MSNSQMLKLQLISKIAALNNDATLTQLEKVLENADNTNKNALKKTIGKETKTKTALTNDKDSKPDITKLYGTLKLNMSVEEIDKQLKALRNEWERDF